jgi:putative OPT family oligopeptide transporter
MAVVMLIAGFLFSAVASYMAGLVGSSNNPVSGMTIATLFTSALLLASMGMESPAGPMAAIFIGAVVCCAIAIGGDNMQDLKTGQLVGATPWKQQVMQMIGVLAGALVMAPVLTLLLEAYGIGPIVIPGKESDVLQAPQATLMASVAKGVFTKDLPWPMVGWGCGIAAGVILCDLFLEARKAVFRMPVLAVAVGLYLPLELGAAIFFGGLVAWAVNGFHLRRIAAEADGELQNSMRQVADTSQRSGLLLAAGLITGEAILGILLAIPIVANEGVNPLEIESISKMNLVWPGMILFALILILLYRTGTQTKHSGD